MSQPPAYDGYENSVDWFAIRVTSRLVKPGMICIIVARNFRFSGPVRAV